MTSKFRFLVAVAIMAPLFVWASPTKATGYVFKELVTNGTFEDQTPQATTAVWQSINSGPTVDAPGDSIMWMGGIGYNSFHSIQIGTRGYYQEVVRQKVTVPAGAKNITVSMFYLKTTADYHNFLDVSAYFSTISSSCGVTTESTSSPNWRKIECRIPDGYSGTLTLDIRSYKGVQAYIDNVSVMAEVPYVSATEPQPSVLGAINPTATLTTISLTNGGYTSSYQGTPFTIKPFAQYGGQYTGRVYARKITMSYGTVYYIFITTDASKYGSMVIYNAAGQQTDRNNPFGNFKPGLNVSMGVMKNSNMVFLAVAPKKWGKSVSLFQLTTGQFTYVTSVALTKYTSGDLRVKLLTPPGQDVILGATLMGKPTTLKAWSYSAMAGSFFRNAVLDKHLRVKNGLISWK